MGKLQKQAMKRSGLVFQNNLSPQKDKILEKYQQLTNVRNAYILHTDEERVKNW